MPVGYREAFEWNHQISLSARDVVTTNFGLTTRPAIRGRVFEDRNGNRQADPGEGDLVAWRIYADLNENEKFDADEPNTFAAYGGWSLDLPSAGSYVIRAVVPDSHFIATAPSIGLIRVSVASGEVKDGLLFGGRYIG